MDPLFRKNTITCIRALLSELRPVRFPESKEVTAVEVIELKKGIRRNCEVVMAYAYAQLRSQAILAPDLVLVLKQLIQDAHETRRECGKVTVNFLGPRNRRILTNMRGAYEEMRLACILACQQIEPALMDSLTVAL